MTTLLQGLFGRKRAPGLEGLTDWHCHLLPGVDDGARTLAESLEILAGYERAGIREAWLTPHIMEDVPNGTAALRERFAELSRAYRGPVRLHLAAENMMDALFAERLAAGDLLPLGHDGRTLLVETSCFGAPVRFRETLSEIMARGYFPLLAHPERYAYLRSLREYRRLREAGVLFQLNLLSLGGHYGPQARKKAEALLADGLYDRAGTDIHGHAQLAGLLALKTSPRAARALADGPMKRT